MNTDRWAALGAVILVTLLVYAFGWQSCAWHRDKQAERRQLEADEMQQLTEQRAPMPTYRGWLEGSSWQDWRGAQDRQYEAPAQPDHMAMAATGYALGLQRAAADEVTREADAIWAEVEANPDLWRHR